MKLVLIVEGHHAFREALAKVLVWDGFDESAEARSVAEGRRRVATLDSNIDVAVVDLELPDESGMEFIRDIRESESDVPVLVLGLNLEREVVERLKEMGVGKVLGKEASGEEIVAAIRQLARA